MRSALLITLITCLTATLAFSQPITTANYETMVATAEEAYANQDYYNALQWYEDAYEEKKDRELTLTIAELHYLLRDYGKAERWYGRLLSRDKENEHAEKRFIYGKLLKMTGNYPEAIVELQRFASESYNDSLKALAQTEITGAQMAQDMPDLMKGLTIDNVGKKINSKTSEYSPVFGSNTKEMYFSAMDDKEIVVVDESNTDYHAKIFKSVLEEVRKQEQWTKPEALDNNVNRPGAHTTNVSLSADGRTMYFTRATIQGNVVDQSKIYYAVGGDSWGAAQEVKGVNSDDYRSKMAVEGELFGNQVLFFVSDMPGGYGGFDIYYATKEGEGAYANPVNLGEKINSRGDEETPFYRDGTLYFSSDGHPNLGGMDIFFSSWDGSTWSPPENMGKGYNTNVDDLYFSMDASGYNGFLSSNRPGGRSLHSKTCCYDIYSFNIAQMYADLRAGMFTEDKKVLKGGTMQLVEIEGGARGNTESKTNEKGNVFGFPLNLEKAYVLVATADGYFPDSVEFNTVGLTESQTFEKRLYLKAKPVEPEYDTITTEKPIVLENILYDFDDDRITEASEPDLQVVLELMNTYPEMIIELGSHTDNRGPDEYNRNLSQRRAESARRWLMRKGVERARIEAKGYGESAPQTVTAKWAALYDYLNEGDELTEPFIDKLANEEQQEQAHSFNRRTEFKILEGPKTIVIKNTIRKKTPTKKPTPKRKALPADPVQISTMSSLYGKKNLKGVPIMKFKDRVIDFGKVKKGEKRTHTYEFTNEGDTDLTISIISACDCTTTDYSTDPVKPGESGKIEVIFDSTEKEESETIDVDIILENEEPDTGKTIIEMLQYKYELLK